jgi:hypothetical protein
MAVEPELWSQNGWSDEPHNQNAKTPLQLISQGTSLPGIPQHPTYAARRQWLLEKMALAFRVFARKGYTDGLAGHISVRDPEYPHTFWTVRNSFAEARAAEKRPSLLVI